MWQLWIDTGGTFTDGIALAPDGTQHRAKVLSSSQLRGQLDTSGRLAAPWLTHPIFAGYHLRVVSTGDVYRVDALTAAGQLTLSPAPSHPPVGLVELWVEHGGQPEEAPVLAARLLTQTPLDQPFPPLAMRLGTTRGTNALLERRGGRVALLVTKGFRDLLVIGTQQRPHLFQLAIPPADLLYTVVLEVEERVAAETSIVQYADPESPDRDGLVLTPLTTETIASLLAHLRAQRPDAVAVSLLNAYRTPVHEQQLRAALHAAGFLTVTLSTDVSTAPGYVTRTQTTVVDAYLTPVLRTYLANVQTQMGPAASVHVITSTGGLVRASQFRPKDSLLSGPAGGVVGATSIPDHPNVVGSGTSELAGTLTLDMGGTSTDVARIERGQRESRPTDYRYTTQIGPFLLQLPSLAIETVAAGGGSVCWFDAQAGLLRVGPQSAGASPGPACYGVGDRSQPPLLTVTDVNLLLGRLHPAQFGIPILPDRAEAALAHIADQITDRTGQRPDTLGLLRGFMRIADETMAGAIRTISVARGFDPARYRLLAFGGAGGLHGCAVARLLCIRRVTLPFDGGLLSAWGIGQAPIERMAFRSVLQPLTAVYRQLATDWFTTLEKTVWRALLDEQPNGAGHVRYQYRIALRFMNQTQPIELELQDDFFTNHDQDRIGPAFRQQYQTLFGYCPAAQVIEVDSIRVVGQLRPAARPMTNAPVLPARATPAFWAGHYPVYDWPKLQPGDSFGGPALLLNATSSAFIEPGWQLTIGQTRDATAVFVGEAIQSPDDPTQEIVQLELFTRRFMAIAEEMGAQLQRTAFSVNVKERLDFSCALLSPEGELVANAPHIPVHLGSLGVCARLCLAKLQQDGQPLGPGDVIITNHPNYGGSHLPDITLLQGVYADDTQLIGYVINRAHHAEIGGKVPGSMPPDATNLTEEGVVLVPQYLIRAGQWRWDAPGGVAEQFTQAPYPTRALAENRADIEAALASLRAGEAALQTLVRQHSLPTVQRYMTRLRAMATDAVRTVLAPLNGQTFKAGESLDDGHHIQVSISIRSDTITFDFTGTSGVHPYNLNANLSILHSVLLYVLRLWVDKDIPLNEGLMAPVNLVLPESSFLHPRFGESPSDCPAVVGGNTEVSQRLVDTLLKALGLAACSQGTMNNFLFGSAQFGYYETIGGGAGATIGAAGRSAVHQHMTNTKLTDPEELERRYPVRLHRFAVRHGSGGGGTWRGGDGLIREIEFLAPVQATLLSQHRIIGPYGLNGGEPGATGQQWLIHPDGREELLPGSFTRAMQPGERIRIETPGGGGAEPLPVP